AGTLRGMHYQVPPAAETKLVRCTAGAVHDVIVDLRPDSPTYLKHFGELLTAENRLALYVPELFAHGYLTLTDGAEVVYQVGEFYTPGAERGIRYDDPALAIPWPREVEVISAKDSSWPPSQPERPHEPAREAVRWSSSPPPSGAARRRGAASAWRWSAPGSWPRGSRTRSSTTRPACAWSGSRTARRSTPRRRTPTPASPTSPSPRPRPRWPAPSRPAGRSSPTTRRCWRGPTASTCCSRPRARSSSARTPWWPRSRRASTSCCSTPSWTAPSGPCSRRWPTRQAWSTPSRTGTSPACRRT